ncbi:MAG: PepSY domain-containing protein [Pseudomonadota bacterium]
MDKIKVALLGCLLGVGFSSMAAMAGQDRLGRCLDSVRKQKAGDFVKVESLDFEGKATYEIELRDAAGSEWEFMCRAETGEIFEIEEEVGSAEDPRFKAKMKIDLDAAKKKVLERFPGTVEEVEYEIEPNGDATYEIDVVDAQGRETKVEVNAATGEIIESSREKWQIGEEADEKR